MVRPRKLTTSERKALEFFLDGEWHGGKGQAVVDHLACRGLLARDGKVDEPQTRLSELLKRHPDYNTKLLVQRANTHQYQITRVGCIALGQAVPTLSSLKPKPVPLPTAVEKFVTDLLTNANKEPDREIETV